jgi:mevalonate kinase
MRHAPAKIILFGEHAVVYGQPAIAVPFTALQATADSEPAPPGTGLTILASDLQQQLHIKGSDEVLDNALSEAARLTLNRLGVPPPDLSVTVSSTIPLASGLGSGAAVTTALIRELSAALGSPLEGDELNDLVYEVEKMHHGTPSGIDNTVIVKGAPVYFIKGQPPKTFEIGAPLTFVIADSGIQASTKESVGAVRDLYNDDPEAYQGFFEEIGAIVEEARQHIERGNLKDIGHLMNRNHHLLNILTVSSPLLNTLVSAARETGALGAKLSGGGRGGNVIALVEPEDAHWVADAFQEAGAVRTWTTTVGKD